MEWNVKNALDRNVEREHLNKILKEISNSVGNITADVDRLSGNLSNQQKTLDRTIIRIINNEIPASSLVTSVTLKGEVTGTSVPVPGSNSVIIQTQLTGSYVPEAPIDSNAYWRYQGAWSPVPSSVFSLTNLTDSGYVVIDDNGDWQSRTIETVSADRIVVENGNGSLGNTTIDLAEVSPSVGGDILKLSFDAYGRRVEEDTATTDDLVEGSINQYWKEAPSDGQIYGRQNETWQPIPASGGFVPFFIPDGQVFTVPQYQQALYSQEITLDGTGMIVLEGILIEVD